MSTFVSKRPSLVAIETASAAQPVTAAEEGGAVAKPETKKLNVFVTPAIHSAMKRSCQRRGVAIADEVPKVLEAFYRGGPAVPAAPIEEFAEDLVAEVAESKRNPNTVRISLVIPAALHAAMIDQAVGRHKKISDEFREILTAQYKRAL